MKEKWRDVVGYEGEYIVSSKGRIISLKNNKKPILLKTFLSAMGYPRINLMRNGKLKQVFVHRLVAESFIGEIKEGFSVNHKDGKKENNCLTNLEIVTHKDNIKHSIHVLGNMVKPVLMLDKISFEPIKEFISAEQAGRELGIDSTSIWRVCNKERNFAGGFSWCYKEDYSKITAKERKERVEKGFGRRKVYQIDPETNEVIKTFFGVLEAERQLGLSSIKHCVAGLTKTAGGFKWSYEIPENAKKVGS